MTRNNRAQYDRVEEVPTTPSAPSRSHFTTTVLRPKSKYVAEALSKLSMIAKTVLDHEIPEFARPDLWKQFGFDGKMSDIAVSNRFATVNRFGSVVQDSEPKPFKQTAIRSIKESKHHCSDGRCKSGNKKLCVEAGHTAFCEAKNVDGSICGLPFCPRSRTGCSRFMHGYKWGWNLQFKANAELREKKQAILEQQEGEMRREFLFGLNAHFERFLLWQGEDRTKRWDAIFWAWLDEQDVDAEEHILLKALTPRQISDQKKAAQKAADKHRRQVLSGFVRIGQSTNK